ncbi:protein kinase domain-containing protein [Pantanalinema rosaneae CENA516]|uniref:protein kinase domain-containing protein n=1 Tax=Pantanalinema rosaneae TaxID=1620701 RepID=UPI003D6DD4B7
MFQPLQVLQERYQLQTQLGRTGAGRQTWKAIDLQTQATVILKLLAFNPQLQWDDVKLFERESLVLKHLNHPQIPKYRDYFAIDASAGSGLPWFGLVQEYIPGVTLEWLLEQNRGLREDQAYDLANALLQILIYLHELSPPVLHRDIKPSNIILGQDKQFYLVDFGAVQDRAKAEGASFTVVGTHGYAAPEQLWGRAVAASDLYGLGTTLLHLLTGVSPAELPQQNLRLQFRDRARLSPKFADWLEQLVAPSLERRFRTAREAQTALQSNSTPPTAAKTTSDVSRLALLSILGLMLGGGLLGFSAVSGSFLNQGRYSPDTDRRASVGSMNRTQYAYFLEFGRLAPRLDLLGLREMGPPNKSDSVFSLHYRDQAVFNYAMPIYEGQSVVGAVFIIPSKVKSLKSSGKNYQADVGVEPPIQSIVCFRTKSSASLPPPPVLKGDEPVCAEGTEKWSW